MIAFRSGMSAKSDLRAAVDAGVPVGVVAGLLSTVAACMTLPRYLDRGGKVFVDSGAYKFVGSNEEPDWKAVFSTYEGLIDLSDAPENLTLVAPDKVGDQEETLRLLARHRDRIRRWIDSGARVIVALQRGDLAPAAMLEAAKEALGTDRFVAGLPCVRSPVTPEECASLRHHSFHILGRVETDPDQRSRLAALLAANPEADLSADATWMRSRLKKVCAAVEQTCADIRSGQEREHLFIDHPRATAVRRLLQADAQWGCVH